MRFQTSCQDSLATDDAATSPAASILRRAHRRRPLRKRRCVPLLWLFCPVPFRPFCLDPSSLSLPPLLSNFFSLPVQPQHNTIASMSSPHPALSPAPGPDHFESESPRQSEASLSTLPFDDTHPKISPLALPIHASTSTISRESDSRPPYSPTPCSNHPTPASGIQNSALLTTNPNYAIPPLFAEPLSTGRIPKGRVFVHRDRDRPRTPASTSRAAPITATATEPTASFSVVGHRDVPLPRPEKRCISDLQDVARRAALTATLGSHEPPPPSRHEQSVPVCEPPALNRGVAAKVDALRRGARHAHSRARSNLENGGRHADPQSSSDRESGLTRDTIPSWIPEDELRDWAASPMFSKADGETCGDGMGGVPDWDAISSASEDDSGGAAGAPEARLDESRWGNSIRNISGLYARARSRPAPAIRGSVLEVAPPTLTERLGLPVLTDRRHVHAQEAQGSGVRAGGRPPLHPGRNGGNSPRGDEYVGFLVKNESGTKKAVRKGWRRFLRRGRS